MAAMGPPDTDGVGTEQRVLVVDDDRTVGTVLARLLNTYRVTFVQSAAGGLARVAAGGRFAAIVCDLNMPGIDGIAFHAEVARLDEALARRIVFVTGGADARQEEFLRRASNPRLTKPFGRRALHDALASVMEGAIAGRADPLSPREPGVPR